MAHSRRKFFDLHVSSQSQIAGQACAYISQLYDIEREIKTHLGSMNVCKFAKSDQNRWQISFMSGCFYSAGRSPMARPRPKRWITASSAGRL